MSCFVQSINNGFLFCFSYNFYHLEGNNKLFFITLKVSIYFIFYIMNKTFEKFPIDTLKKGWPFTLLLAEKLVKDNQFQSHSSLKQHIIFKVEL